MPVTEGTSLGDRHLLGDKFMDLLIGFSISSILLILSVVKNIFVAYPLLIGLAVFIVIAVRRGYKLKDVLLMAIEGGKKSIIVLQIFVLIGAIISIWMASGTVPAIVYYGMKLINPKLFILSAFLLSCVVSILIGTSFGTVGTVGISLIVMAKAGSVSIAPVAGAIIAGAYFGDRCSPMSSSANLVANITETDLYINIKNMVKTTIIPFLLSIIFYTIISLNFPISNENSNITSEIAKYYTINIIVLVPAVIIFALALFKVRVKLLMLVSIAAAFVIAVAYQHVRVVEAIKYMIAGYNLNYDTSLKTIIKGGGILSMLKISLIVFISSAFTGIFEKTGMLKSIEEITLKAKNGYELFLASVITSILASAFGCTQALAVILTDLLMKKAYENSNIDKYGLALDLENSAIIIAPLIPWNIAVLMPLVTLSAGFDAILYCFYLFAVPLVNLITKRCLSPRG